MSKKKIEIKPEIIETKEDWFDNAPIGELTVDVYQTDKELVIQSTVAGIEPKDLDISIENEVLIIKGKRENQATEEDKNYFYQECYWGQFQREIVLPVEVDESKVKATMEKGVLTIRVPKLETKKKISIKT
jgi:HSP20 family protein